MQNEEPTVTNNHTDETEVVSTDAPAAPVENIITEAETNAAEMAELAHEPDNGEAAALLDEIEPPKKERFDFRRRALLRELESKEKEIDKLRDDYLKVSLQYAELKDRHLRFAAEMENSRKRLEREFAHRAESKVTELLAELLPVADDIERFFGAGNETKDYDSLAAGARLIYQNVVKILQSRGVSAMATVGHEFDPNRHEALLQMPVEGQSPNVVVQETAKGYLLFDKVLRPAKVIVSV